MAVNHMSGGHAVGSRRARPWTLAGIIVGGDLGLLSGMAYANTFTRDLLPLLLWSVGGAIVAGGVLGAIGMMLDNARGGRSAA